MHLMNNNKKSLWRNKPMQTNESKDMEWVSVSELARRIGKTKQTVYNYIKQNLYETMEFRRGKMIGILVKVPKEIE